MKKQLKFLLFAVLMLTLVMMTMICVSAAADGDMTQADEHYFKVEDKDGNLKGYYINLGSVEKSVEGGAWSACPDGGKILQLKDYPFSAKTMIYLYSSANVTFDGQKHTITNVCFEFYDGITTASGAKNLTFQNVTVDAKGNCPVVFGGTSATYNFDAVTLKSTGSYGIVLRGTKNTLNLKGKNNSISSSNNAIVAEQVAYVNIYGGTYSNSSNRATIETKSPNGVADDFDFVMNIYDGTFTHSDTATSGYYNAVISAYNTAGQKQINIYGGTFNCAARFVIVKLSNDILDLNIAGGTFNATHASAEAIVRFFNNGNEVAPTTIGGKTITSSIDITGGTFDMTNTGMPIIYSYTKTAIGTSACPVEINVSKAEIVKGNRLMVLRTGGYFDVTVSNIKGAQVAGSYGWIEVEGSSNANISFENCELVSGTRLLTTKGTSKATMTIKGGSYTLSGAVLVAVAATPVDIISGNFTIATPAVLNNENANISIKNTNGETVKFTLSSLVTADFDFTQMTALYNGAANKASVEVVAKYRMTVTADLANITGPAALKSATGLTNVPDYVKLNVSLIVQNGATVTFTGGTYDAIDSFFVRVDNGKVIANNITLTSLNRAFYISQADASVELVFNNCNISTTDGHIVQGNTGSNSIAKLYLTVDGGSYTANGGRNLFSFGATEDAEILIKSGDFNCTSFIGYVGSAGTYTVEGGTFNAKGAIFSVAANATFNVTGGTFTTTNGPIFSAGNVSFTANISGATLTPSSAVVSIEKNVAASTIAISDCVISVASHAIYSESEAEHIITISNSMLVQTVEKNEEIVSALGAQLALTDVIILSNQSVNILNDTMPISENAPTVLFAGDPYLVYMTFEGEEINQAGAEIYMGLDSEGNLVDGIRFTSALSDDVIAVIAEALAAGKTVSYGTVIAPADYVVAAGAFTMAALDQRFGSVDGKLGNASIYANVPAKNSLRDSDGDGVYEVFSAMLVNIKEANYTRAFAAIGYVVIDGEIFYSAFNTVDNARSAQYVANALLEMGFYEGETEMIAILNKYAGVAAE